MTIAWVLGATGLLGSSLRRSLHLEDTATFAPAERFRWASPRALEPAMARAVEAFGGRVEGAGRWEIYWAAGIGTMSSSEHELALETQALSLLLSLLGSDPRLMAKPGLIAFASSAGAIYAGSNDPIITEDSSPAPTTPYAREKLKQEQLVRSFVEQSSATAALLARISTLYGPGQSLSKKQGLLAHIARCILRNDPIQIYVPFDTIRDYILSDDAAMAIISSLRAVGGTRTSVTQILASEQPTTIAEIISIFKRIARRPPRIVTSASGLSRLYSRRTQFRSLTKPVFPRTPRTSLLIGIAQVMAAERVAHMRGPDPRTA